MTKPPSPTPAPKKAAVSAAPPPVPLQPPPPPPPPAAPNAPPVQPALFTQIGNGFLVYCGLVTATAASILASLDKIIPPTGLRECLAIAAGLALGAGVLSLFVMASTHNHARRAERGAVAKEIDAARRWTIVFATGAMTTIILAAAALGLALFLYVKAPIALTQPAKPVEVKVTVEHAASPSAKAPLAIFEK